jgi:hypothetical protein
MQSGHTRASGNSDTQVKKRIMKSCGFIGNLNGVDASLLYTIQVTLGEGSAQRKTAKTTSRHKITTANTHMSRDKL